MYIVACLNSPGDATGWHLWNILVTEYTESHASQESYAYTYTVQCEVGKYMYCDSRALTNHPRHVRKLCPLPPLLAADRL